MIRALPRYLKLFQQTGYQMQQALLAEKYFHHLININLQIAAFYIKPEKLMFEPNTQFPWRGLFSAEGRRRTYLLNLFKHICNMKFYTFIDLHCAPEWININCVRKIFFSTVLDLYSSTLELK